MSCDNLNPRATAVSSTIITMLPSSPQVKSVYSDAIVPALSQLPAELVQSTLCIDSTTLDVDVARDVAFAVTQEGARMVDAPVSGGTLAEKPCGNISIMMTCVM